jgi:hypothetical protein
MTGLDVEVLNPIGAQPSEVLESGIRWELFERSEFLPPPLLQCFAR